MKSLLSLFVASTLLPSIGSASVSHVDLEHVDSIFISTLTSYAGNIGFTNFQGSLDGEDYMISLFYDVDAPLVSFDMVDTISSHATGAFGIYVFNMTNSTMVSMYSTQSAILSMLEFKEMSSPYYEDNINAWTMNGGYFTYSESNGGGDVDTTTLLNTQGGTIRTLAAAGFPFTASPASPDLTYMSYKSSPADANPIVGNSIHSSGLLSNVVPEPSTAPGCRRSARSPSSASLMHANTAGACRLSAGQATPVV